MKQFFFLLLTLSFFSSIHAQLNKGQWMVGGNAAFSTSSYSLPIYQGEMTFSTTQLQINPGAGYFIIDKLGAGLRLTTDFTTEKTTVSQQGSTSDQAKLTQYGVSPFVRYYFLPKTNKVNLLADVSYSYLFSKSNANGGTGQKDHSHAYTFTAGPAFVLNTHVSFELTASYEIFGGDSEPQHVFMANAGFQIHLGK